MPISANFTVRTPNQIRFSPAPSNIGTSRGKVRSSSPSVSRNIPRTRKRTAENVDRDGRPISVDQLIDQMRHKTPIMSMRYIKQARKLEIGEAFFGEAFVQSLSQ